MLMVVSDKTTVLMESAASGTEIERKINLLLVQISLEGFFGCLLVCLFFREVKKYHWGKKCYKHMNMIHLQDWNSTHVKVIFLYSQTAGDKFKIVWGIFLVSSWLSYHASRQKKKPRCCPIPLHLVVSLISCSLSFIIRVLNVSLVWCLCRYALETVPIGKSFLEQKSLKDETQNSALFAIIYYFAQKYIILLRCVSKKLCCWSDVHAS